MTDRVPDPWQDLGIPPQQIKPGLGVMVAYTLSAAVNNEPALICFARVVERASSDDAAVFRGNPEVWWLNVYTAPHVSLPQMFRADQILGIPALGIEGAYKAPSPVDDRT